MTLTILNFADGKVYQKNMNDLPTYNKMEWQSEDYEDYLVEYGFSLSNIEWMTSAEEEGLTPIENHG
mgnify:FL=1|jgi:hypothetical protein